MPTDVRTEARLTLEYLIAAERYLRAHDRPVEATAVRDAIDRFVHDHAQLLGVLDQLPPLVREPSATALYVFRALRDAIDFAIAEGDPHDAITRADHLLKMETAINMPEHRLLSYRLADGPDVVTFTYQMRTGSSPLPGEDDEHSFLLVLRVDGQERDRHYKIFRGV